MRPSNLAIIANSAVQDQHVDLEHVDNGYVDSHTDTYYNDWGGSDSDSGSSSSSNKGGGSSNGGCLEQVMEGFGKTCLVILAIFALLAIITEC